MNSVEDMLKCLIPLLVILALQADGSAAEKLLHRTRRQDDDAPVDFKCPKADGLFADPETCKKFYICAGYYPFSQNCPSSLYFDDIKKFCTRKTKQLACGPVEQPDTVAPPTPDPNATPGCDPANCVLPECYCSSDGTQVPGGLEVSDTPQMILLSFDGAVNSLNFDHYRKLLTKTRTNPNGCPIKGTFFVSHEYTSHFHIQKFYADGHEIAIHSISNRSPEDWWAAASYENYAEEMVGQREILHKFANISRDALLGMRVPYLHPGGNDMMNMLYDYDFVYDSSIIVPMSHTPVWPYTLDYRIPHKCMQGTCPTRSFPGLWEIPLNTLFSEDGTGGMCSLADQCVFQENDDESVEQFLKDNFKRHYNVNRAPPGTVLPRELVQRPQQDQRVAQLHRRHPDQAPRRVVRHHAGVGVLDAPAHQERRPQLLRSLGVREEGELVQHPQELRGATHHGRVHRDAIHADVCQVPRQVPLGGKLRRCRRGNQYHGTDEGRRSRTRSRSGIQKEVNGFGISTSVQLSSSNEVIPRSCGE